MKCPKCGSTEIAVEQEEIVKTLWYYYEDTNQFIAPETIRTQVEKRSDILWFFCENCDNMWDIKELINHHGYSQGEIAIRSVKELNKWLMKHPIHKAAD